MRTIPVSVLPPIRPASLARGPAQPGVQMLADLVAQWRARAEQLGPYAPAAARAFEHAAAELERELQAEAGEALTLPQAADASGYSADYLGRMIRDGRIANAGRPHAPRIRRADLPRKANRLRGKPATLQLLGAGPGEIARAVVTSDTGEGR